MDSLESPSESSAVSTDPWRAFSIGLIGVIVGFGIGRWRTPPITTVAAVQVPQVVQAPLAPILPPAGGQRYGGCGV